MERQVILTEEQLINLRNLIDDNLTEETKIFYKVIYEWFKPIVGFLPTRVDRISDNIHEFLASNE